MRDDEAPVGVCVHVELDAVCAELDRALEGGQRVLGQIRRRAAVRYDKHRRMSSASMRSTSSSACRSRSGSSVPTLAITRSPAAFADAMPASVSSKTSASRVAERVERRADSPRGRACRARRRRRRRSRGSSPDPGGLDDRLDLVAGGAGADRERHAARRRSGPLLGRAREPSTPSRDRSAIAVDALLDHGVDVGVVCAEPVRTISGSDSPRARRSTRARSAAYRARRRAS